MSLRLPESRAWMERLADLLPAREAPRVLREVEALVLDRAESEVEAGQAPDEAERRALARLGSPEALADTLVSAPLTIGLAVRRSYVRWFAVLVACHLLLSVLLTLGKSDAAAIPGLLGPLPTSPWHATLTAVLGQVLLDAGLLGALFVLMGGLRGRTALPVPRLVPPAWTRAEALRGLVLLLLLAVLAHPLRDEVFAVHRGASRFPFLAPDFVALLPWLDVLLGLWSARLVLVLVGRGDGVVALLLDVLAGAAGIAWLLMASTRSEVVRLPQEVLGADAANVLGDLVTRCLLVVFVVAALLLTLRTIQRALRLRRVLALGRSVAA